MKLSPAEVVTAVESEEALCLDNRSGTLQGERVEAMDRYRGLPLGNEVDGRSQVVDRSIADCIEWIMPSLVRVYLGSDDIGQFEARGPEDEAAAKQETEVCNWYITTKNDFYSQINATLRDALLLKNGYMVGYWHTKEDKQPEVYVGLSDDEATMLAQDAEVEVVEHTEYPDPQWQAPPPEMVQQVMMQAQQMGQAPPPMPQAPVLHDIKVERKKAEEWVAVESIPPDEMLVGRRHRWTSLVDADFVQWRRRVSIGQLRAEGFKIKDDEGQTEGEDFTGESVARSRFNENLLLADETQDPARRQVLFKDTYMRLDLRGKGQTQLWRICIVDGQSEPCLLEEASVVPFAAFSPIVFPHSHIGSSVYDLIADLGVIKTTLLRQYLDSTYLQTNGRMAVDITRLPSLDDLLVNRPGGLVRVEGNPAEILMPLVSVDVTAGVLNGLQYIDATKEQRTGVRSWTAGLEANSLHPTATGVASIDSAASQRIELIARTLASGFRDLWVIVHCLALKHSTKALQVKLRGKWTTINPREWTRRTDFSINVGLGVGTPDAQLGKLNALAPLMGEARAAGLAGPQEMYNYGSEIVKAAGYKNPDKFLHPPAVDPQTGQPMTPPPQPDPIVQAQTIKSQGEAQIAQAKGQMDMQVEQAKMQAHGQAEQARAMADIAIDKARQEMSMQIEAMKAKYQAELDLQKHSAEQDVKLRIAEIQAATTLEAARIKAGLDDGLAATREAMTAAGESAASVLNTANDVSSGLAAGLGQLLPQFQAALQSHAQAMSQHAQVASMPKRIVRDPVTGKAIGVEVARTIQ